MLSTHFAYLLTSHDSQTSYTLWASDSSLQRRGFAGMDFFLSCLFGDGVGVGGVFFLFFRGGGGTRGRWWCLFHCTERTTVYNLQVRDLAVNPHQAYNICINWQPESDDIPWKRDLPPPTDTPSYLLETWVPSPLPWKRAPPPPKKKKNLRWTPLLYNKFIIK